MSVAPSSKVVHQIILNLVSVILQNLIVEAALEADAAPKKREDRPGCLWAENSLQQYKVINLIILNLVVSALC